MSSFTVRTVGLDSAIERLRKMSHNLKDDFEEVARRIAEEAYERVSRGFSPEEAVYDGVNDTEVEMEKTEDGYIIKARGEAVLFIEFGTGVYFNGGGVYPDPPDGILGIGEYGKGNGKKSYWYFTNKDGNVQLNAGGEHAVGYGMVHGSRSMYEKQHQFITHGNPANMVIHNAYIEAVQSIPRIVREVLKI